MNIVIYQGNSETLICAAADEGQMLKTYFVDGGRSYDDYDREEVKPGQVITLYPHTNVMIKD